MATLTKGTTFASGDVVTAGKLNNLVDGGTVTFLTAADTDDSTLEVSGNKFRVKDLGISTGKLADASVTAAKLAGGAIAASPGAGARYVSAHVTNIDTIELYVDQMLLRKSSDGSVRLATGLTAATVDPGASGRNGIDTGSASNDTWYYLWAIWNGSDSAVSGLLSTSATSPTLPSGYEWKALVGAVRRQTGSFRKTSIVNGQVTQAIVTVFSARAGNTSYASISGLSGAIATALNSAVPTATDAGGRLFLTRIRGVFGSDDRSSGSSSVTWERRSGALAHEVGAGNHVPVWAWYGVGGEAVSGVASLQQGAGFDVPIPAASSGQLGQLSIAMGSTDADYYLYVTGFDMRW